MKITKILVYQVDLDFPGGTYHLSKGRTYKSFDNTIVAIETDAGITGWGETCPFGNTYIEASAVGARTAISIIAPHLIGLDPRRPEPLYAVMDEILVGHRYAKSALDMAFWDILGKSSGLPLCDLWGGRFEEKHRVKRAFSLSTTSWEGDFTAAVTAECDAFKQTKNRTAAIKATGNINTDIAILDQVTSELGSEFLVWMDANSGWGFNGALKLGLALKDRNLLLEQPCATYEECRLLRQRIPQQIMLDEIAVDMAMAVRARNDGLLDHYNMKTARVGGLSKARKLRDFLVELGVPIHFQCTWGAELGMAGMLHLAQSTAPTSHTEFWMMTKASTITPTADGSADAVDGFIEATHSPGLGIKPRMDVLGDPIVSY